MMPASSFSLNRFRKPPGVPEAIKPRLPDLAVPGRGSQALVSQANKDQVDKDCKFTVLYGVSHDLWVLYGVSHIVEMESDCKFAIECFCQDKGAVPTNTLRKGGKRCKWCLRDSTTANQCWTELSGISCSTASFVCADGSWQLTLFPQTELALGCSHRVLT